MPKSVKKTSGGMKVTMKKYPVKKSSTKKSSKKKSRRY
jgi:hypothetical protein